jgi:regulator of sirC expression with transglutaminase-like and TPR domain
MSQDKNEFKALIKLLDDTDPEIIDHIRKKLISLGPEAIPMLEEEWGKSFDPLVQQRIERIVHVIQFDMLLNAFTNWKNSAEHDLLEGLKLIARINYPDLNEQKIHDQLNKLSEMALTETGLVSRPLEKIMALNRVMFDFWGFRGNTANFHSPQNSFINTVLESRKGNPLMLSAIYIIVARQCNMPVYGVNLPEHFICAYQEHDRSQLNEYAYPDADILFYINPFSRGNIFGKDAIDEFLKKLDLKPQESFFIPCQNEEMIIRSLRNLENAFRKTGEYEKQSEVSRLIHNLSSET